MRLEGVYGARFRGLYKTEESLLKNQAEWRSQIGKLSREEIDEGIARLKAAMVKGSEFSWPDIAGTIRLCKKQATHPSHKDFDVSKALPKHTPKAFQQMGQRALANIKSIIK